MLWFELAYLGRIRGMEDTMKSIDYFKKRKRLNKQITPKRAHVLISKFPEDAIALIYDVTYKKFLLMGDTGVREK